MQMNDGPAGSPDELLGRSILQAAGFKICACSANGHIIPRPLDLGTKGWGHTRVRAPWRLPSWGQRRGEGEVSPDPGPGSGCNLGLALSRRELTARAHPPQKAACGLAARARTLGASFLGAATGAALSGIL